MLIPEQGVSRKSERYFFTPSNLALSLLYYPTRVGHYFCDSSYHFDNLAATALLASHQNSLMLMAVTKGALTVELPSGSYHADQGKTILFDCQEPHAYTSEDGTEFFWLLFDGLNARQFYRNILQLRGNQQVFSPSDFHGIRRSLSAIVDSCTREQRLSESSLSIMIHRTLCDLLLDASGENRQEIDVAARAASYIDEHIREALTVEQIAEIVGLSPSHFSRLFKSVTGYPPYEYALLQRINTAKHLLTSTKLSIREIAASVGYASEEHFSHSFRKRVGISPGRFRKYPT